MTFLFRLIVPALFLMVVTSCVPNRKVTLLQKNDLHQKNVITDSVVRSYASQQYDYRVQANDILSIRFESITPAKYDFLSKQTNIQNINLAGGGALIMGEMINEKGEIPFPILGKVQISGLTVFQVQDTLQQIANQYLESPVVKVSLINFRMTLLGEVASEGTVLLTNNRVTMLEAIGVAGGLGEFADRSNIKLIRNRNGKTEVQYLNLLDENFVNSPYYYVYQNDVLIVPPLKQKPFRKYFGQNLSLLVSTVSLLLLAINLTQ